MAKNEGVTRQHHELATGKTVNKPIPGKPTSNAMKRGGKVEKKKGGKC